MYRRSKRRLHLSVLPPLVLLLLFGISERAHAATIPPSVTILDPAWTASIFAQLPFNGDNLVLDNQDRLYATSREGIFRIPREAQVGLWSQAGGFTLAIANDFSGYLTTRCLSRLPDGSTSCSDPVFHDRSIMKLDRLGAETTLVPLTPGIFWLTVVLDRSGRLFANASSTTGVQDYKGIYRIDKTTGNFALAAPGPFGIPGGMTIGSDGKVYTLDRTSPGPGFGSSLYRLDLEQGVLTKVMNLPFGALFSIAADNVGNFFTTAGDQVWLFNPSTQVTDLIATGVPNAPAAVVYDVSRRTLFVRGQGGGDITAFERAGPTLSQAP